MVLNALFTILSVELAFLVSMSSTLVSVDRRSGRLSFVSLILLLAALLPLASLIAFESYVFLISIVLNGLITSYFLYSIYEKH